MKKFSFLSALTFFLAAICAGEPGKDPFSEINVKLDLLTTKLNTLQNSVNAINLGGVNSSLAGLGAKADNISAAIASLQSNLAGIASDLSALSASIDSLKPRTPGTTTKLRFNFVTNQGGFDTGVVIINPNMPASTAHGTCTVNYFGSMASGAALPGPQTTVPIAAGQLMSFAISQGGVPGAISNAAGFQGYLIVDCGFPGARGYALFSDVAANRIAASLPVEILEQ